MSQLARTIPVRTRTVPPASGSNELEAQAPDRGSYPFGAPRCRIYQPARSVLQAGWGRQRWLIQFEPQGTRWIEPLMGWSASDDPFAQIRLEFATRRAAVAYAERMGLDYTVIDPAPDRRKHCAFKKCDQHLSTKGEKIWT